MSDLVIKLRIPETSIPDAIKMSRALREVPQIANPEFIDHEQTPDEPEFVDEFTSRQWIREVQKRTFAEKLAQFRERERVGKNKTVVNYNEITLDSED